MKLEFGDNWQYTVGGAWDTVMLTPPQTVGAVYVGSRFIDSDKMAVFKTPLGYFAQTEAFCRSAGGKKRHASGKRRHSTKRPIARGRLGALVADINKLTK